MKLKLLKLAGAGIASALIVLPAAAQTSGDRPASSATPSGGNGQTYSTESRKEDRDWGWVGLLGLVGLAGLMRKQPDDTYRGSPKIRGT